MTDSTDTRGPAAHDPSVGERRRPARAPAWRRLVDASGTSALAGGVTFFALVAAGEGDPIASLIAGLRFALVGALYGTAVGALIRWFPVPSIFYPAAGFLAAPAVLALFVDASHDEGAVFIAGLFGLVLGVLEHGAARRRAERAWSEQHRRSGAEAAAAAGSGAADVGQGPER